MGLVLQGVGGRGSVRAGAVYKSGCCKVAGPELSTIVRPRTRKPSSLFQGGNYSAGRIRPAALTRMLLCRGTPFPGDCQKYARPRIKF